MVLAKFLNICKFVISAVKYELPQKVNFTNIGHKDINKLSNVGCYIIGTKRGLFLLDENRLFRLLKGIFYGITIISGHIYCFQKVGNYYGRIIAFELKEKIKVKTIIDRLSIGCHQIDYFENNLYITDTYNNKIIKYNIKTNILDEIYPLGELERGRNSENYGHINSIYMINDKIFLMCHNETIKTGKCSQILVLGKDFTIKNIIETNAKNAHNIYYSENKLIYCDSINMTLKVNEKIVFQGHNLTRGLSISDDLILVGGSEFAKREKRTKVGGNIYILNKEFILINEVQLPGMV